MELATFAVNDGYSEAILRGLRSSFLKEVQYGQMKNCTTIGELKTFLEETDYAHFLQTESNDIAIPTLREKLTAKLAGEINYIQSQSVDVLAEFMDLIRHKYMIDNVVNIIESKKQNPKSKVSGIHPLGMFDGIDKIGEGDDLYDLYTLVLIDTPVGVYFMRFLEEQIESIGESNLTQYFKDLKPEDLRNQLKKLWLEDFYEYVQTKLSGCSQEVLLDLLKTEADFKNIQVCYNTFGRNNVATLMGLRQQLCPSFGYLYPDCDQSIRSATTLEALRDAVKGTGNYKDIMKDAPDPTKMEELTFASTTLEDIMMADECRRYCLVWDQAAQYAVFYAYLRLKELEIKNIIWIAEMIARKKPKSDPGYKKIIVPFADL